MPKGKKVLYTLAVDGYPEAITRLTFPWLRFYADKIGADFHIIRDRKFPGYPPVYEKLQIYELGKHVDWNIYIDADALINPEMFDVTDHLDKDTVAGHGKDMSGNRFRSDRFFLRDGRFIGMGNWFTVASNWCIDLWEPLKDISLNAAVNNITVTIDEAKAGIEPVHLIDDYVLSRNLARYGMKHTTILEIINKLGRGGFPLPYFHVYTLTMEEKIQKIQELLLQWGMGAPGEMAA
jgi:hypothetical protein